jgi:hypothetical protein
MKRIKTIITASILAFLMPFAIISGQDKKSEQRIKIVVAEDGGSKVILDTLITGKPLSDSIVLKDGRKIKIENADNDLAPGTHGSKKYIVTASASDGKETGKKINKEITIISSDSDMDHENDNEKCRHTNCTTPAKTGSYSYTIKSDEPDSGSESAKYVINRDGMVITVEGSDYARVKETIKDIENTLDKKK